LVKLGATAGGGEGELGFPESGTFGIYGTGSPKRQVVGIVGSDGERKPQVCLGAGPFMGGWCRWQIASNGNWCRWNIASNWTRRSCRLRPVNHSISTADEFAIDGNFVNSRCAPLASVSAESTWRGVCRQRSLEYPLCKCYRCTSRMRLRFLSSRHRCSCTD